MDVEPRHGSCSFCEAGTLGSRRAPLPRDRRGRVTAQPAREINAKDR